METKEFIPDTEAIAKRQNIIPFGRAVSYERAETEIIEFQLAQSDAAIANDAIVETVQTNSASAYVPPSLSAMNIKSTVTEVTVRVSNIPIHLSFKEVYDLFMIKCGKIFNRCNLVTDRETRVSKGVAYVGCSDSEKAAEFAKAAMNIVVDNFKFCSEILSNK